MLKRLVLSSIEEKGRIQGSPKVDFPEKQLSVEGEDICAGQDWVQWLSLTYGFYLALPSNAYGVVISPDGTSRNMSGGLYEVPAGLYKLKYVDKHERLDFSAPVSEMTTDGEKLTLRVLLRYHVIDPVLALSIDRPVETLIEHLETDLAQYIRTHDHSDIAESSDKREYGKLLAYFTERHGRRDILSHAFSITGVEIKDFAGDKDYVELRRQAQMEERKNKIEKERAEYEQELNRLKAQHRVGNEKIAAEHKADLEKRAAEHKADLEKNAAENNVAIEKMQARHEKETQEILDQVRLREIELDDKRKHLEMRANDFSQLMEALSRQASSGAPINPALIKPLTDWAAAYMEEMNRGSQSAPRVEQKSSNVETHTTPNMPASPVEKLTKTLLDLLNPRK